MLGFDALGKLALGQLPHPASGATAPFSQLNWEPAKRAQATTRQVATFNLALIASLGPFTQQIFPAPFPKAATPHPAQRNICLIASLGPFSQTNWTAAQGLKISPVIAPFNVALLNEEETPFFSFIFPAPIKASFAPPFLAPGILPIETQPPDLHDGVWVKRKRKKLGPDQIDLEVAERASRRAALELAVYGPEVTYEPQAPVFESPKPLPDVTELAKVIAFAQAKQHQANRVQSDQDEEADLEAILREIL